MNVLSIRSVLTLLVAAVLSASEALELVPRIISGVTITNRCRAPYNSMVALQFFADYYPVTFCSAVMLTDTYLVTTAKCIIKMAENKNQVAIAVVGERDTVMTGEPEEQRIGIKDFKIHHQYNRTTRANDIGMIQLARPAKLGRCVKPAIRMENDPTACEDVDESCQIVGWGSYSESQEPMNSRLPRAASVTVYSDLITVLLSSVSREEPPLGTLYAETINPRQKACFFDWGGVVSCRRNGNNVLRGIISNHNCNSQRQLPILIVDITYYKFWIKACTENWDTCVALRA